MENDAQLKKAIKKDDDESNRCYQADFVENNLNTVRGRAPIARLKQKLKYLNVDELSDYLSRGEKISVRSSNHLTHLIPSKEMTIEEAMQNFRAIGEVLYVPKCL